MPPLSLEVSKSISTHYAGSPLDITCTTIISEQTDIHFNIIPTWSKDGHHLPNTTRISTTPLVYNTSLYSYMNTLTFTTLSETVDSGVYQCLVLLVPVPLSPYITPSPPAEINVTLSVLGKYISPAYNVLTWQVLCTCI